MQKKYLLERINRAEGKLLEMGIPIPVDLDETITEEDRSNAISKRHLLIEKLMLTRTVEVENFRTTKKKRKKGAATAFLNPSNAASSLKTIAEDSTKNLYNN
jgi:hypothetical protein